MILAIIISAWVAWPMVVGALLAYRAEARDRSRSLSVEPAPVKVWEVGSSRARA